MKLSVVIPAHNGKDLFCHAIESVLSQSRKPDEVLVIDDASTDSTAESAKSYEFEIKYYFNHEATGFADAWNRAIERATGDFVALLHQDDLLYPIILNI